MKYYFNKLTQFLITKWGIWTMATILLFIGGYFMFFKHGPSYSFVSVKRGSISEIVSITGNTTPQKSVSLAFGSSGIVARTYTDLGRYVTAGQVLVELNINDLSAQLRQAEANVTAQQAKLDGLKGGSRPEDIASSQAILDKAKQDLVNMYSGIIDASTDSYAKANDAVRIQVNAFFSNGETLNPSLTYSTVDTQTQTNVLSQRPIVTTILNTWQSKLATIDQSSAGLETLLQSEVSNLATIRQLLTDLSSTLNTAPTLSATTLATYKTNVSLALSEVNTATKNLNTISQGIASQKLIVAQLQSQLDLKKAGSLPTDISAQQAQVEQAQANVESVKAKIQNSQITAPISGTITQFDAKIGQLASPNIPLVSIMSNGGYEVDAGVSEIDIGKILVRNTVTMVLDAFPNETFTGSVFYIAPAETNTLGVVSYTVKISFDKPDPRLKSGLTANIDIQTNHKDNVLVLPQYAILQNDAGTFVETLENKIVKQNPVKLGIQSQKGDVEVISGVTEGQQVLNIGLKVK